jgi:hypothetical protein
MLNALGTSTQTRILSFVPVPDAAISPKHTIYFQKLSNSFSGNLASILENLLK